ncbi:hypothetical protein ACFL6S_12840 [Candidatus Poribacteria bacterium]
MMEDGSVTNPQVEVFLNNNPRRSAQLESVPKGEKWSITNTPSIIIQRSNFENGKKVLIMTSGDDVIAVKEINVAKHNFVETIELHSPLENPRRLWVEVGVDFHKEISMDLRKLHGMVTYFDGSPVKYPIIHTFSDISVVGDEKGNFEIFLCSKERSIGVFERNYSKGTLECWLYDVELKENTRLDIRIDKLEVYRLRAWEGEESLYVHFIPMSDTRVSEGMKRIGITAIIERNDEIALLSDPEIWPHLEMNDVKVYIGEKEVPILTFTEVDDFLFFSDTKALSRPGYILAVLKRDYAGKIIRIEIRSAARMDEEEILEKGEGYFFGFVCGVLEAAGAT